VNKIPPNSQVSVLKGFWFIFQDGDREIAAWASALTFREQVFINKQLLSEKRSLNIKSKHHLILEENVYEIVFNISNFLTGKLNCSLIKDDVLLECITTSNWWPWNL
jgi:hypothetical protein